jgi:hypothetical protein
MLHACVALQGVFEHLQSKGVAAPPAVGLQVMVHGTVPLGEQGNSQTQLTVMISNSSNSSKETRPNPQACTLLFLMLGCASKQKLEGSTATVSCWMHVSAYTPNCS